MPLLLSLKHFFILQWDGGGGVVLVGGLACGHDTGARDHIAETSPKEKQSEQIQENCTQCTHCKLFSFFSFFLIFQIVAAVIVQKSSLWDQQRPSSSFAVYSFPSVFQKHPTSAQPCASNIGGQVNNYATILLIAHIRFIHGGRRCD